METASNADMSSRVDTCTDAPTRSLAFSAVCRNGPSPKGMLAKRGTRCLKLGGRGRRGSRAVAPAKLVTRGLGLLGTPMARACFGTLAEVGHAPKAMSNSSGEVIKSDGAKVGTLNWTLLSGKLPRNNQSLIDDRRETRSGVRRGRISSSTTLASARESSARRADVPRARNAACVAVSWNARGCNTKDVTTVLSVTLRVKAPCRNCLDRVGVRLRVVTSTVPRDLPLVIPREVALRRSWGVDACRWDAIKTWPVSCASSSPSSSRACSLRSS
mmetsp:Transcript_4310/g.12242  ORF Transcript_4310/g.12242 Transcript_4310/m.12242 type:complete len:272 (+) Transcript_4310:1015-1830(+)